MDNPTDALSRDGLPFALTQPKNYQCRGDGEKRKLSLWMQRLERCCKEIALQAETYDAPAPMVNLNCSPKFGGIRHSEGKREREEDREEEEGLVVDDDEGRHRDPEDDYCDPQSCL